MNLITINSTELPIVEYRGQRVVTLAMIDEVHKRPEGTARRNFNEHRARFVEGVHCFEVTADEIRTQSLGQAFAARTAKGVLLTERGYMMLTKPFNDDLAWDVQSRLVDEYFSPVKPSSLPQDLPGALRLAADLAEEKAALALENQQQAKTIASLESLFMTGETPTQFCKRLNGVNCSRVNSSLLAMGWLFDAATDENSKARYRVASRVRDRYLTERPRKISAEGSESFVKYDLVLLIDGARRLHQFYMKGELAMKSKWDGLYTQAKHSGSDGQ
jgi:hypothetical protein